MMIFEVCGREDGSDRPNSTTGKTYSPGLRRLPCLISKAACDPEEKNSFRRAPVVCWRAESVSIIKPVS